MVNLSYTSRINGDLTLAEYLFGTELGVDNLVARESAVGSGSTHPGKTPPAALSGLLVIGLTME